MILDTQELAASREKERQLRHDMTKLQTDLDKERLKNKTIADKVESIYMNFIRGTTNRTKSFNILILILDSNAYLDKFSFHLGDTRQSTDYISRTQDGNLKK